MYSQPPGLSSNSINSIFFIDHCVYTVSVQCRREKLWIFCIVAVCTDRHLIGIFPISHKVLYTLAAIMSLSNYLKMYSSSVWRWWYLNIYSIFVRSYLFHSYVYCRRPKKKKKMMQLSIIWMFSCVFCILLLSLWLYSSLNKKRSDLKMCGDRLKDEQEDRRKLIRIKWTCSFTQRDPSPLLSSISLFSSQCKAYKHI